MTQRRLRRGGLSILPSTSALALTIAVSSHMRMETQTQDLCTAEAPKHGGSFAELEIGK